MLFQILKRGQTVYLLTIIAAAFAPVLFYKLCAPSTEFPSLSQHFGGIISDSLGSLERGPLDHNAACYLRICLVLTIPHSLKHAE